MSNPNPTSGIVADRVHSLVASHGFHLSKDPWDFEYAPSQGADRMFRIDLTRTGGGARIGGSAEEEHRVVVWLARKTRRDPHGAIRQLRADLDLIEASLLSDTSVFYVLDDTVNAECRLPLVDSDFVVAQLSATVSFEHE